MIDIKINGTEIAKGIVDLEITNGELSKVFDKIEKTILKVGDKITVNDNPKQYRVKRVKRLKNGIEEYTVEEVKE